MLLICESFLCVVMAVRKVIELHKMYMHDDVRCNTAFMYL